MRQLTYFILSFCCTLSVFARDIPAEVVDIDFNDLGDNWVQMTIEIRSNGNPAEDAKNSRFVDNIKVMAYLAYENKSETKKFDFYKAQAEIVSIEQGKQKKVHFFMPGVVIDRDRLPRTPPYYFVALEVNGRVMPLTTDAYSQGTLTQDSLRSMKQKADAESDSNDFVLMQYYHVPRTRLAEARLREDDLAPLLIRQHLE